MRVLVACEFPGTVRDAFLSRGHNALSCDLQPTESPGPHYEGDVRDILDNDWDLMIAHPPCTYLARVSAHLWASDERMKKAREAFDFFMMLWNAPIPMIAIENPIGLPWKWFRHPDQVVHPWMFGHNVTKATCLWLKRLSPLLYTLICPDPMVNWTEHGHRSGKDRSRTFSGIADAMATQWGNIK